MCRIIHDAIEIVRIHLIRVHPCPRLIERLFSPFMTDVTRLLSAIEQGTHTPPTSSFRWFTTS